MTITREQCRAARGLIDWSQLHLAEQANLGNSTIRDFEAGRRTPHPNNLAVVQLTFENAGVEFIPSNGGGVGVRLKPND